MTALWLIGTIAERRSSVALDLGALCLCLGLLVWITFRQLASKSYSPAALRPVWRNDAETITRFCDGTPDRRQCAGVKRKVTR